MLLRSRRANWVWSLAALALLLSLATTVAWACSVPVYRYGLERWPADPYRAIVFYQGELTTEQQAWVDALSPLSEDGRHLANLKVATINVDQKLDPEIQKFWDEQKADSTPWIVMQFPQGAWHHAILHSAPLTAETSKLLLTSPARTEVAKQLLAGKSSSWIFLECGDSAQDEAAYKTLKDELARMPKVLKLPEQEEDPGADPFELPSTDNLKIDFSIVRVSRDDPAEAALVSMLLNSEDDLLELSGPMAFPVFARGRALYALIDKGINANTIESACGFLIGPCSCEVKAQNPGTDLLMQVDWEGLVKPTARSSKDPPALSGLQGFVAAADPDELAAADKGTSDDKKEAAEDDVPVAPPVDDGTSSTPDEPRAVAVVTSIDPTKVDGAFAESGAAAARPAPAQFPHRQLAPIVRYSLWGLLGAVLLLAAACVQLVFGR